MNRDASILKIDYTTEIPQKGVDILNELVKAYNVTTVENKNRVVDNTVKFIDGRLILLTSELGKVEQGLQDFRQKNEILDIKTQGEAQYNELQTNDEKLKAQEVKLQVLSMIQDYLNNPGKKYSLVPSSLGIEDPTLNVLINNYNQLQLDREQKLKTMPEANPAIQLINGQIEKVRISMLENLANIRQSVVSLRNRLQGDINSVKGQVRTVPAKERELLEIARQQGIKEKLYLFLLQKREKSAITMASSTSNASAIDPAVSSGGPVSPDRNGTFRLALILGLALPAAYIYLRELLNDKINSRSDIKKLLQCPLLARLLTTK